MLTQNKINDKLNEVNTFNNFDNFIFKTKRYSLLHRCFEK